MCPACSQIFKNAQGLRMHQEECPKLRRECPVCRLRCVGVGELMLHQLSCSFAALTDTGHPHEFSELQDTSLVDTIDACAAAAAGAAAAAAGAAAAAAAVGAAVARNPAQRSSEGSCQCSVNDRVKRQRLALQQEAAAAAAEGESDREGQQTPAYNWNIKHELDEKEGKPEKGCKVPAEIQLEGLSSERCISCKWPGMCLHVREHIGPSGRGICGPHPLCVGCSFKMADMRRGRGIFGQVLCPVCRKSLGTRRRALVEAADMPVEIDSTSLGGANKKRRLHSDKEDATADDEDPFEDLKDETEVIKKEELKYEVLEESHNGRGASKALLCDEKKAADGGVVTVDDTKLAGTGLEEGAKALGAKAPGTPMWGTQGEARRQRDQRKGGNSNSGKGAATAMAAPLKDLYAELGVPRNATDKMLERAYRQMALVVHPDKPTGSKEAFQRLFDVYQALLNPSSRAEIDAELVSATGASSSTCPPIVSRGDQLFVPTDPMDFATEVDYRVNGLRLMLSECHPSTYKQRLRRLPQEDWTIPVLEALSLTSRILKSKRKMPENFHGLCRERAMTAARGNEVASTGLLRNHLGAYYITTNWNGIRIWTESFYDLDEVLCAHAEIQLNRKIASQKVEEGKTVCQAARVFEFGIFPVAMAVKFEKSLPNSGKRYQKYFSSTRDIDMALEQRRQISDVLSRKTTDHAIVHSIECLVAKYKALLIKNKKAASESRDLLRDVSKQELNRRKRRTQSFARLRPCLRLWRKTPWKIAMRHLRALPRPDSQPVLALPEEVEGGGQGSTVQATAAAAKRGAAHAREAKAPRAGSRSQPRAPAASSRSSQTSREPRAQAKRRAASSRSRDPRSRTCGRGACRSQRSTASAARGGRSQRR